MEGIKMTKGEQDYLVSLGKEFQVNIIPCIVDKMYAVNCNKEFKTTITDRAYNFIRETETVSKLA
jgi:hypothetical protein